MNKQKLSRRLAKEILLFFSALLCVGLVGGSLWLQIYYYKNRLRTFDDKFNKLTEQIASLPEDRIKLLYEGIKDELVECYQADTTLYFVPKGEEQDFIKAFPKANRIENQNSDHFSVKINSVSIEGQRFEYYTAGDLGKKIKKKYPEYTDVSNEQLGEKILNKYQVQSDSSFAIIYVELKEFRENFKNKQYRDKFFASLNNTYDFGTPAEIEVKVHEGLKYTNETQTFKDSLEMEKKLTLAEITHIREKSLDSNSVMNVMVWMGSILGFILYPLRLCYLIIRWSMKTLKKQS